MNAKGKLLNVAFAVTAAFVFGDHLGFTAGVDSGYGYSRLSSASWWQVSPHCFVANLLAPKLLSKIKSAK